MRKLLVIVFFSVFSLAFGCSCRTQTNAQKATKIAKKRWKHIKHDCNCHSYVVYPEDVEQI